jgi:hypothetical protein
MSRVLLDMDKIKKLREDIIKLKQYLAYRANCKQKSRQNAYDKEIKSIIAGLDETCLEPLSEYLITKAEIKKRTKESMDKLRTEGQVFTGPMFGWDNVEDGTVVPNWDEQDLIDYMRHLYMKDDRSAAWISRKMNNDNITGKKGGKWLSNGVLRTIRNTYHLSRNKYPKPDWWGDSYYHDANWV